MAEYTGTAVQGTVLRIVKLDACGVPVTGASSAVVITDGYVSVEFDPQYVDGDVFQTKKANGNLCLNKIGRNVYGNTNLNINMCVVDPDAHVLMLGARLISTSAPVSGTGVAYGYNNPEAHFSLETWQPLAGQSACDPVTGLQRYLYWAWPHVWNGKKLSGTIENGPLEVNLSAMTNYPSALWGDGPGTGTSWLPGPIDTTSYVDDFLWNITVTPPPSVPAVPGAFLLT
jgi:hypothetical protein